MVLVVEGGCSFVFSKGPPRQHREMVAFECSTSRFPPAADAMATLSGLAAAGLLAKDAEAHGRSGGVLVTGALVGAGVYLVSSVYGGLKVRGCSKALEELQIRNQQRGMPLPTASSPAPQSR
jgi:hypothetical protein